MAGFLHPIYHEINSINLLRFIIDYLGSGQCAIANQDHSYWQYYPPLDILVVDG